MCGRFATGAIGEGALVEWLALSAAPDPAPVPRWNVAPSQRVHVVREAAAGREMVPARWGLIPHWWRKPLAEFRLSTFNARFEEAAKKPVFRDAYRRCRCLVPAIGYYEWTGRKGAKRPHFITVRRNAPGFCMAGLWSEVTLDGASLRSFTILTTAAPEATRELHPRAPVILDEADWAAWLDPAADPAPLLHALPSERYQFWEVAPAVGNVANEGEHLADPAGLRL